MAINFQYKIMFFLYYIQKYLFNVILNVRNLIRWIRSIYIRLQYFTMSKYKLIYKKLFIWLFVVC